MLQCGIDIKLSRSRHLGLFVWFPFWTIQSRIIVRNEYVAKTPVADTHEQKRSGSAETARRYFIYMASAVRN